MTKAKSKQKTKVNLPKKDGVEEIHFPASVLAPVRTFLSDRLKKLEKNKKEIEESDPFSSEARVSDNAAPDTEAEEQFGHALTSAAKDQIERRIIQTRKALTRVKIGKYAICENCGKMIDTDRLIIYPEATRCVDCERKK
ncbi:MAG TPA: TraR/DksA C4-type zinc finger protein [Patescibacteria group bacterium]